MKTRAVFLVALLALLLSALPLVSAQDAITVTLGPVSQRVIDRDSLVCGANQSLQGFGFVNDEGQFEGFDIDVCRAVAAAILGDATKVEFRPLQAPERQAAMQSGEIDIMSRNTTMTLSRDSQWATTFGPITFYDGQGVIARAELGIDSIAGLDGGSICVQTGTTTELNITDYIEANSLSIELQVFADANATWEAYVQGRCDGFTTDKSGLAAYRSTAEDPGAHVILPETISKEPLAILTPQNDPQFAEVAAWTVYGLIQAEEFGITSANVAEFLPAEGEADDAYTARVTPAVARFLGQAGNQSGNYLGIANDYMVTVITQVGNYGEIYERNLVPIGLERAGTLNDLWTRGGLMYSPPFR
ncbi:MAG: amino acid ABC transporter substrate-binding protein [Anaerolineae bacterium]|nr:amino acid ABC transporter substrate-binding protein [Anaerolineae bacterium]